MPAVLDIKRWYKNTKCKTLSEALSQGQLCTALQLPGMECWCSVFPVWVRDSHSCPTYSLWRRLCGYAELGIIITV